MRVVYGAPLSMYMEPVQSAPAINPESYERCHAAPPVGEYLHVKPAISSGRMVPCWTLVACAVLGLVFACAAGITTYVVMSNLAQTGTFCGVVNKTVTKGKTANPARVTKFNMAGIQYFVNHDPGLNWFQAQKYCLDNNATLVTFETKEKWLSLYKHLFRSDKNLYFGATNGIFPSREYLWISGKPFTFSNWYPGLPKNTTDINCIYGLRSDNYRWVGSTCYGNYANAMCEKTLHESYICRKLEP